MKKVDWWQAYRLEAQVADIIHRQEVNGWKFDRGKANFFEGHLTGEMERLYEETRPYLRKVLHLPYKSPISQPFLKSGDYSAHTKAWFEGGGAEVCVCGIDLVSGPFSRVSWREPNIGSDKQVKGLLLELGWVPTEWNYKKTPGGRKIYDENKEPIRSSPKLTEDSFGSIQVGIGPLVAEYLKAKHRRSAIQGWLKRVTRDGFVHALATPLGTPTGRFTHRVVVNVPKPKDYVYFGREMRSLFICREGYKLVGHDFSGLEARVMAHYLDDPDLTARIIHGSSTEGTDFHSLFWETLKEFITSRDNAKNVEYA